MEIGRVSNGLKPAGTSPDRVTTDTRSSDSVGFGLGRVFMNRIPQNPLWHGKFVDWITATVKIVILVTQESKTLDEIGSAFFSELIDVMKKSAVPGVSAKVYVANGITACINHTYYPAFYDTSGEPKHVLNITRRIQEPDNLNYTVSLPR